MAVAEDLKIQVMMVGGRRCGKTSVLAAMKRNFDELFNSKNLVIRYGDTETLDALEDKNAEIEELVKVKGINEELAIRLKNEL